MKNEVTWEHLMSMRPGGQGGLPKGVSAGVRLRGEQNEPGAEGRGGTGE